jgi:hypothetical protein
MTPHSQRWRNSDKNVINRIPTKYHKGILRFVRAFVASREINLLRVFAVTPQEGNQTVRAISL